MDDPSKPRIEIFAPFEEAFETTKRILFRPFDVKKWFVIGFAAWLATFFSGSGFNYRHGFDKSDWNRWTQSHGQTFSVHNLPPWFIPVAIAGGLFVFAIAVLLLWLNSRGRFMFTDCIVRNRGAIAAPWREYRQEGNRYFVLQLLITLCSLIVFGGLALIFVLGHHTGIAPLSLLIISGIGFFLAAIVVALIMHFMVPVMYRQHCEAMAAFRQVWALMVGHPGVFLLFVLFLVVLYVAAAMIGCLAACATCCIAAVPYLGTVILLPVVMFLYVYPLCFLRQFGDAYDVWAVVRPTEPPLPSIPPMQEPLPPA
jgi:hypothetical protein